MLSTYDGIMALLKACTTRNFMITIYDMNISYTEESMSKIDEDQRMDTVHQDLNMNKE